MNAVSDPFTEDLGRGVSTSFLLNVSQEVKNEISVWEIKNETSVREIKRYFPKAYWTHFTRHPITDTRFD